MADSTTVTTAAGDSIEVSVSTKGVYTYTAKVYYDSSDVKACENTQTKLKNIDIWFKKTYEEDTT